MPSRALFSTHLFHSLIDGSSVVQARAAATDAASGGSRIMPNESKTRTAVVVGSTGIIGRSITAKLAGLGGWRVLGATRSGGTVPGVDEAIAVDLSDPAEARRRLAPAAAATCSVLCGLPPQANGGGGRAELRPLSYRGGLSRPQVITVMASTSLTAPAGDRPCRWAELTTRLRRDCPANCSPHPSVAYWQPDEFRVVDSFVHASLRCGWVPSIPGSAATFGAMTLRR